MKTLLSWLLISFYGRDGLFFFNIILASPECLQWNLLVWGHQFHPWRQTKEVQEVPSLKKRRNACSKDVQRAQSHRKWADKDTETECLMLTHLTNSNEASYVFQPLNIYWYVLVREIAFPCPHGVLSLIVGMRLVICTKDSWSQG